jgi:hypothetical protein
MVVFVHSPFFHSQLRHHREHGSCNSRRRRQFQRLFLLLRPADKRPADGKQTLPREVQLRGVEGENRHALFCIYINALYFECETAGVSSWDCPGVASSRACLGKSGVFYHEKVEQEMSWMYFLTLGCVPGSAWRRGLRARKSKRAVSFNSDDRSDFNNSCSGQAYGTSEPQNVGMKTTGGGGGGVAPFLTTSPCDLTNARSSFVVKGYNLT